MCLSKQTQSYYFCYFSRVSVEVCAVASMFSERITTAKHCFGLEYIISLSLTLGALRILIMGGRGGGGCYCFVVEIYWGIGVGSWKYSG